MIGGVIYAKVVSKKPGAVQKHHGERKNSWFGLRKTACGIVKSRHLDVDMRKTGL
jgi:hypothetical protein